MADLSDALREAWHKLPTAKLYSWLLDEDTPTLRGPEDYVDYPDGGPGALERFRRWGMPPR